MTRRRKKTTRMMKKKKNWLSKATSGDWIESVLRSLNYADFE